MCTLLYVKLVQYTYSKREHTLAYNIYSLQTLLFQVMFNLFVHTCMCSIMYVHVMSMNYNTVISIEKSLILGNAYPYA